jgi:hypothetical protein
MISQRLGFIFDPVGAGELRADPSARQPQLGVQQIARRADTGRARGQHGDVDRNDAVDRQVLTLCTSVPSRKASRFIS